MLDLVNRLHMTGCVVSPFDLCDADVVALVSSVQIDIDLPLIAVIGNQSAGKSSLIESISGITLPRAAGTCTRCVLPTVILYVCADIPFLPFPQLPNRM